MIPEIGLFLLCLAFSFTTVGLLGIVLFHKNYPEKALRAIKINAWLIVFYCSLSFGILIYSYGISDFSVSTVVLNSCAEQSLFYRIASVWSNHEGSMMLWLFFLQITLTFLIIQKNDDPINKFWSIAVQTGLIGLFLGFIVIECDPFKRFFPLPKQGLGLNPALHDISLGIHPPTLYSAIVGYSGLFSLSIAGALSPRFTLAPQAWAIVVRPWALYLWALQTAGITLGSWWAYYELGWGGWWVWDPVENVSLLPWLIGLGFLHCLKPGLPPARFTRLLIWMGTTPFLMAVFGTFLVRSGVISSLHAFANDFQKGLLLLGLFCILGLLVLFVQYSLKPFHSFVKENFSWQSPLNIQLLLLSGCTISLLFSFILLIVPSSSGFSLLSLHPLYFKVTFMPFFLALVGFMPWGYAKLIYSRITPSVKEKFLICSCISLGTTFFFLTPLSSFWIGTLCYENVFYRAIGFGITSWVLTSSLVLFFDQLQLKKNSFLPLNKIAGLLAHGGMGLFLLGATAQTFCSSSTSFLLSPGESTSFDNFTIEFTTLIKEPHYFYSAEKSLLKINAHKNPFFLNPENHFFPLYNRTHSKTAIHSLGVSDLYVALGPSIEESGSTKYLFNIYKQTFIRFLWLGAFLMVLGALLKGWSIQRRKKLC